MKRYRVAIKNSKENRIELTFPDLCIKYNTGYAPALKVKEGEEILFDVLDSEDIRKSWLVGSLKGYLENKWIEVIPEDMNGSEFIVPISQFITEQMAMAPKPILIKKETPQEVPSIQSNLPEVKVEEKKQISPVIINEPITDLTKIFLYEDFSKLSQVQKLHFIKESSNVDLLKDISGKTLSPQLKNNIQLRMSQL